MTSVIDFRAVSKSYKGHLLFQGVSFAVEKGKTYALRGPNGSGKSVLLRLMCRMTKPTGGEVEVASEFLDSRRVFPDRFGVMIDGPAYLAHRSGMENLLTLAQIRKQIGRAEISSIMESFGLDPENRKSVRRYSMGMKQKLSICQALMEAPDVFLLDEPFNALDDASVGLVKARLHEMKAAGKTIIMTSHNSADLDEFGDASLRIQDGYVHLE